MSTLSELQSDLPKSCRILAVSKLQSTEKIFQLYNQGQRFFGENYVQEALSKMQALEHLQIQWHFIGHLQRKKVKDIIGKFELIHSVDSIELAQALSDRSAQVGLIQPVLFQINLSGESSKNGFSEGAFLKAWPQLQELSGIRCSGLMTMPPLSVSAETSRVYFHNLRKIRDRLKQDCPSCNELSMGTTSDYLVAAQEGATWVRLGTLLFGERSPR